MFEELVCWISSSKSQYHCILIGFSYMQRVLSDGKWVVLAGTCWCDFLSASLDIAHLMGHLLLSSWLFVALFNAMLILTGTECALVQSCLRD